MRALSPVDFEEESSSSQKLEEIAEITQPSQSELGAGERDATKRVSVLGSNSAKSKSPRSTPITNNSYPAPIPEDKLTEKSHSDQTDDRNLTPSQQAGPTDQSDFREISTIKEVREDEEHKATSISEVQIRLTTNQSNIDFDSKPQTPYDLVKQMIKASPEQKVMMQSEILHVLGTQEPIR